MRSRTDLGGCSFRLEGGALAELDLKVRKPVRKRDTRRDSQRGGRSHGACQERNWVWDADVDLASIQASGSWPWRASRPR